MKYEVIIEGNTVTVKDDKGNEGIAECPFKDKFNLSVAISTAISRLKWKPSFGEIYYSICLGSKNLVDWCIWDNGSFGNNLYERGLVFKTEEEAEKAVKTMLDSIKE